MRKCTYILLSIIITMSLFTTKVFANNKVEAIVSQSSISLDGQEIWNVGFNVSGNNYFKLRDIAESLSGSTSQFEVSWNGDQALIEIITGKPYTPVGGEKTNWYNQGRKYYGTLKDTNFLVDGKEYKLPIFNIDGSNYFKLRDLGELVGFDVNWDKERGQILLFTKLLENTHRGEIKYDSRNNNLSPSFPRWKDTVTSYITENKDGTIIVVDGDQEFNIEIDIYDDKYNFIKNKKIEKELPIFGGFYSGEKYNYIAFGQSNKEEKDNKEVIRITRYDKNFMRIDSVSVKGGESFTRQPFDAAGGRMSEYEDRLVFHTSRERYTTEDGVNHQSQLTIVVDTLEMKVINYLGRFQDNHVSHSFDQYVLFDNNNHVLVDHGDAYPRSIILSRGIGSDYEKVNLFHIPGKIGANATGVSVGGFESSSTNYIVAMNTINHSLVREYTSYDMVGLEKDQRDIIISTVPKNNLNNSGVKQIRIKEYIGTDKNGSIPQLVKISEDRLMLMWQEYNKLNEEGDLNYVFIDGQGNPTSNIETIKHFKLSKSQPVVINNKVTWYVNKNGLRTFYRIPL